MNATIDTATNTLRVEHPAHTFCGNIRSVDVPARTDTYNLSEAWLQDYKTCRICGKPVDATLLAYALREFQKPICSSECYQQVELKRYACCEKAIQLRRSCVCAYATECPVHGERHHGTHD